MLLSYGTIKKENNISLLFGKLGITLMKRRIVIKHNGVLQVAQIENMEMTHRINFVDSKLHMSASNGQ